MKAKRVILAVAVGLAMSAAAGNTCTWTGGANDGKWSSAANWDTPPVSGNDDALIFTGGAVTCENDIDDMSIGGICCRGTGTKTFNGKTIILNAMPFTGYNANNGSLSRTYTLSNACTIVYNAKLDFSNTGRILLDPGVGSATFNGDIFVRKGKTLYIGDPYAKKRDTGPARPFYFNGRIDAPEGTIVLSQWAQSTLYINGAVDVLNFNFDYPASAMYLPEFAGGVKIRSGLLHHWYGPLHFRCGDVFGEDLPVMDIGLSYWSNGEKGTVFLDGHTVVIDRLGPGSRAANYPADETGNSFHSSTPATLWMKATGDTSTSNIVRGAVSVVWDPDTSARTIDFKGRKSNTSGSIEVKRGTFRISGAAAFVNVPSIQLGAGTVFEMSSTATAIRPLNSLTALQMDVGARFVVADGTTTPFAADDALMIRMDSSARLVVPSGFAQKVKHMIVNGVPYAAGKYTGEGGTEGTVVDQIEGTGVIEVSGEDAVTYWTGLAGDGLWSTAGNWQNGVPVPGGLARVWKEGTYSIAGPSAIDAGRLETDVHSGRATLDLGAPLAIDGTVFDIGTNSTLNLGSAGGGSVEYASPENVGATSNVVYVHDGGELAISGVFTTSNLYGRICAKDAAVRIDDAVVNAAPPANVSYGYVLYVDGGTLAISNSTVTLGYNFNDASHLSTRPMLQTRGGAKTTIHNTYLRLDQWIWGSIFGTGETTLSGSTQLSLHGYIRSYFAADAEGEECRVRITDSATVSGMQELAVGDYYERSRSIVTIDSPSASVSAGSGLQIGCTKGYGEINVQAGRLNGGGAYGSHLGYKRPSDGSAAATGCFPTGVVKVAGGAFNARGNVGNSHPLGLIVGDGSCVLEMSGVTSRMTGILELSSGAVTNGGGYAIIGLLYGYGRVVQTGGTFRSTISVPSVIGMAGGEGEWVQSGGLATFNRNLYLGGVSTNVLGAGTWTHGGFAAFHNARGLVDVSGGNLITVGTNYDIVVSSDGEGTLSLSGKGSVAARDIILTNTVDSAAGVTRVSTLKFAADASGESGVLTAARDLVIAEDAKFVFDLSAYAGKKTLFRLASAKNVKGAFALGNVEFIGPYAKFAELRQTGTTIEVSLNRGTMILFK